MATKATKFGSKFGSKFGKKTKVGKKPTFNDRDSDDNDFDAGNHSDSGGDHGGGRSNTKTGRKVKAGRQRLKSNTNDDDGRGIDSGSDDAGDNDSGHRDDDDDVAQDSKPTSGSSMKKPGLKKPKSKTLDDDEDMDDDNDDSANDDEGEDNTLSGDPQQTVEDIEEAYRVSGGRPPQKLRRGKTGKRSDIEDVDKEEPTDGEPNVDFIKEVQFAMPEVDNALEIQATRTNKNSTPEHRRNAIFRNDADLNKQFGDACEIVMKNDQVKAILSRAGMKIGAGTIRVISVVGGVGLFGVGAVLTIAALNEGPVKVGAAIAEQVIKGGQYLGKKIDQKLEKDALKTKNAKQLMRVLCSTEEDVAKQGTINQASLATFDRFKLMAATSLRANAEEGS